MFKRGQKVIVHFCCLQLALTDASQERAKRQMGGICPCLQGNKSIVASINMTFFRYSIAKRLTRVQGIKLTLKTHNVKADNMKSLLAKKAQS